MFDHSCGHDRKRPDGLSANNLNKGFGGAQNKMRDTVMQDAEHLGNYSPTLTVGQTQRLVFTENDEGPSWMTLEERLLWKFDRPCPRGSTVVHRYTKAQLITKLQASNLPTLGKKKELEERCIGNGIPITEQRPKILEGWSGKPKGAFQILFERGFIKQMDGLLQTYKAYTMGGSKGPMGELIAGTSLKELIVALPDFVDQETCSNTMPKGVLYLADSKSCCYVAPNAILKWLAKESNTTGRHPSRGTGGWQFPKRAQKKNFVRMCEKV
jgi:hypothetical protein